MRCDDMLPAMRCDAMRCCFLANCWVYWLTGWMVGWLAGRLALGCLADCGQVGWLAGDLAYWLPGCLVGQLGGGCGWLVGCLLG